MIQKAPTPSVENIKKMINSVDTLIYMCDAYVGADPRQTKNWARFFIGELLAHVK